MLQPELKLRRDKIRSLMALQGIDAALISQWLSLSPTTLTCFTVF